MKLKEINLNQEEKVSQHVTLKKLILNSRHLFSLLDQKQHLLIDKEESKRSKQKIVKRIFINSLKLKFLNKRLIVLKVLYCKERVYRYL